LLALLVFVFGCRTIAAQETSIATVLSATDELARRISSSELAIAKAAALRRQEHSAWLELLRLSGEQRPAVSVAAFLRRLEAVAARFHVSVTSVTPAGESPSPKAARSALLSTPITIAGRADFRSIVRFIQEITRQRSLTGLESAQMTVSPLPSTRGAQLQTTIHLTLYRLVLSLADAPAN
jgi:hypothetical protein